MFCSFDIINTQRNIKYHTIYNGNASKPNPKETQRNDMVFLPFRSSTFPAWPKRVGCRSSWSLWTCWRWGCWAPPVGYCTYEGRIGHRDRRPVTACTQAGRFRDRERDTGALRKGFGRERSKSTSWLLGINRRIPKNPESTRIYRLSSFFYCYSFSLNNYIAIVFSNWFLVCLYCTRLSS